MTEKQWTQGYLGSSRNTKAGWKNQSVDHKNIDREELSIETI